MDAGSHVGRGSVGAEYLSGAGFPGVAGVRPEFSENPPESSIVGGQAAAGVEGVLLEPGIWQLTVEGDGPELGFEELYVPVCYEHFRQMIVGSKDDTERWPWSYGDGVPFPEA